MNNRDYNKNEELLLEYGNYVVRLLEEPFENADTELQSYGIYLTENGVCESTTSSLPQAISVAISLDEALKQLLSKIEEAQENGAASEEDTEERVVTH